MAKKYTFPIWLQGTPEEQAAEEERQRIARASYTRAKLSDAERLVGRGELLEKTARANLETVIDDRRRWRARLPEEEQRDETALYVEDEKRRLAQALAMQGKYHEAAETHPDAERREEYREIMAAIEVDDSERCDCEDTEAEYYTDEKGERKLRDEVTGEGVKITVTPRFERDKIYSPVHHDMVSLVECSKCGHLNARPLQNRLIKQHGMVNQNEQAARVGKPIVDDVQILKT